MCKDGMKNMEEKPAENIPAKCADTEACGAFENRAEGRGAEEKNRTEEGFTSESRVSRQPRGILIFGSSGAGKTTLGRAVSERLGCPYFDLDDYIWKKTAIPFTERYDREERIARLSADIFRTDRFVMAGTLEGYDEPFLPYLGLAVHLNAPAGIRRERVHARELSEYGDRVLPGGDMFEVHERFLDEIVLYESGRYLQHHCDWAKMLPCRVLFLNGEIPVEENAATIIRSADSGF